MVDKKLPSKISLHFKLPFHFLFILILILILILSFYSGQSSWAKNPAYEVKENKLILYDVDLQTKILSVDLALDILGQAALSYEQKDQDNCHQEDKEQAIEEEIFPSIGEIICTIGMTSSFYPHYEGTSNLSDIHVKSTKAAAIKIIDDQGSILDKESLINLVFPPLELKREDLDPLFTNSTHPTGLANPTNSTNSTNSEENSLLFQMAKIMKDSGRPSFYNFLNLGENQKIKEDLVSAVSSVLKNALHERKKKPLSDPTLQEKEVQKLNDQIFPLEVYRKHGFYDEQTLSPILFPYLPSSYSSYFQENLQLKEEWEKKLRSLLNEKKGPSPSPQTFIEGIKKLVQKGKLKLEWDIMAKTHCGHAFNQKILGQLLQASHADVANHCPTCKQNFIPTDRNLSGQTHPFVLDLTTPIAQSTLEFENLDLSPLENISEENLPKVSLYRCQLPSRLQDKWANIQIQMIKKEADLRNPAFFKLVDQLLFWKNPHLIRLLRQHLEEKNLLFKTLPPNLNQGYLFTYQYPSLAMEMIEQEGFPEGALRLIDDLKKLKITPLYEDLLWAFGKKLKEENPFQWREILEEWKGENSLPNDFQKIISDLSQPLSMMPTISAISSNEISQIKTSQKLKRESAMTAIAYSSDGRFLFAGSHEGKVSMIDLSSKKEVHTFQYRMKIHSLLLSPNGRFLVVGLEGRQGKLIDLSTKEIAHQFMAHDNLKSASFSPDGRHLLLSRYKKVDIFNLETKELKEAFRFESPVTSVTYSQDGKYILTGTENKLVKLWDGKSLAPLKTIEMKDPVTSLAFAPNVKFFMVGSGFHTESGEATVFDIASGKKILTVPHQSRVNVVAFTPDGRYAVSGGHDRKIFFTDLTRPSSSSQTQGPSHYSPKDHQISQGEVIFSLSFLTDGTKLAVGSYGELSLYDIKRKGGS